MKAEIIVSKNNLYKSIFMKKNNPKKDIIFHFFSFLKTELTTSNTKNLNAISFLSRKDL